MAGCEPMPLQDLLKNLFGGGSDDGPRLMTKDQARQDQSFQNSVILALLQRKLAEEEGQRQRQFEQQHQERKFTEEERIRQSEIEEAAGLRQRERRRTSEAQESATLGAVGMQVAPEVVGGVPGGVASPGGQKAFLSARNLPQGPFRTAGPTFSDVGIVRGMERLQQQKKPLFQPRPRTIAEQHTEAQTAAQVGRTTALQAETELGRRKQGLEEQKFEAERGRPSKEIVTAAAAQLRNSEDNYVKLSEKLSSLSAGGGFGPPAAGVDETGVLRFTQPGIQREYERLELDLGQAYGRLLEDRARYLALVSGQAGSPVPEEKLQQAAKEELDDFVSRTSPTLGAAKANEIGLAAVERGLAAYNEEVSGGKAKGTRQTLPTGETVAVAEGGSLLGRAAEGIGQAFAPAPQESSAEREARQQQGSASFAVPGLKSNQELLGGLSPGGLGLRGSPALRAPGATVTTPGAKEQGRQVVEDAVRMLPPETFQELVDQAKARLQQGGTLPGAQIEQGAGIETSGAVDTDTMDPVTLAADVLIAVAGGSLARLIPFGAKTVAAQIPKLLGEGGERGLATIPRSSTGKTFATGPIPRPLLGQGQKRLPPQGGTTRTGAFEMPPPVGRFDVIGGQSPIPPATAPATEAGILGRMAPPIRLQPPIAQTRPPLSVTEGTTALERIPPARPAGPPMDVGLPPRRFPVDRPDLATRVAPSVPRGTLTKPRLVDTAREGEAAVVKATPSVAKPTARLDVASRLKKVYATFKKNFDLLSEKKRESFNDLITDLNEAKDSENMEVVEDIVSMMEKMLSPKKGP